MKRYRNRSKGIIVEAVQLTDDNASEVSNWANGAQIVEERDALTHATQEGLNVKTPLGMKRLSVGMYLVKFRDELYLTTATQFEKHYDAMTPVGQVPAKTVAKESKPPTTDPFEGMTRFGEGPKP